MAFRARMRDPFARGAVRRENTRAAHFGPSGRNFSDTCRLILSADFFCNIKTSRENAKRQLFVCEPLKNKACCTGIKFYSSDPCDRRVYFCTLQKSSNVSRAWITQPCTGEPFGKCFIK